MAQSTSNDKPRYPRRVNVFGATGSIGASASEILVAHPESFAVDVVSADRNASRLAAIARRLNAKTAVIADEAALGDLRAQLTGTGIETAAGAGALIEAARRPADLTVAAIVGAAGLAPTMAAIESGSDIVLANKECLVCAGDVFMAAVRQSGVGLLPADSEHNAIFQVMEGRDWDLVDRITLTASGGPFRNWNSMQMAKATPEQATAHPTWVMGQKVSVDSATLLNKGLELIEAYHLFGLGSERIRVLIHPQSIVHGLVAFQDGSVLAQMSIADMKVPLANCMWWPSRPDAPNRRLDLTTMAALEFAEPDLDRFPGLSIARQALEAGGTATNILNAANEVAVDAFLSGRVGFLAIIAIVEQALEGAGNLSLPNAPRSLDEALAIDGEGRRLAREAIGKMETQQLRPELS